MASLAKVAICDHDKLLIGSWAEPPENPGDAWRVRRFHCAWKALMAAPRRVCSIFQTIAHGEYTPKPGIPSAIVLGIAGVAPPKVGVQPQPKAVGWNDGLGLG